MDQVETLIQGGAVGLAILFGGILFYVLKQGFRLVSNHIAHNTEALHELKEAVKMLNEFLRNHGSKE